MGSERGLVVTIAGAGFVVIAVLVGALLIWDVNATGWTFYSVLVLGAVTGAIVTWMIHRLWYGSQDATQDEAVARQAREGARSDSGPRGAGRR